MQVPEKLALIGGSILLSSTLVFTLKSQASSIIPSVGHSISHVFDQIGDTQKSSDFNSNFKQAQQKHWTTGAWGTAKYYIDKDMNIHVGQGQLQGHLADLFGNDSAKLRSVNIDESVQAPQDSSYLFHGLHNVTQIRGLSNVDTAQAISFRFMFGNNPSLQSLDLSGWNTKNVGDIFAIAINDTSLKSVNVNGWDTQNVNDSAWVFSENKSLTDLDLSSWHMPNVYTAHDGMFYDDTSLQKIDMQNINTNKSPQWQGNVFGSDDHYTSNLRVLVLGNNSNFKGRQKLPDGEWKNESQTISSGQLLDGNAHPGTWVRQ